MTWRRAALYWLCCIGLTTYYLVAERPPAAAPAAHLTRAAFLNLPQASFVMLTARRGDSVIQAQRDGERWEIGQPAGAQVPSDLIAGLISNLTDLPDVEVVAQAGGDLTQFGLNPPASELVLQRQNGDTITVRLGTRNPAGTAVYAQRNDSAEVFLIGLNVLYYEDLLFEAAQRHR